MAQKSYATKSIILETKWRSVSSHRSWTESSPLFSLALFYHSNSIFIILSCMFFFFDMSLIFWVLMGPLSLFTPQWNASTHLCLFLFIIIFPFSFFFFVFGLWYPSEVRFLEWQGTVWGWAPSVTYDKVFLLFWSPNTCAWRLNNTDPCTKVK